MSDRPVRAAPRVTTASVSSVDRLTPHLIRVVLGGPGLAGLVLGEFTDHYVKLLFAPDGVTYPEPFDLGWIRAELPRDRWPVLRTYTVRRWDETRGELTIDVVHHGDEGVAGPWAARARPGDEIRFLGPSGAYAPDPAADWHLLIGDESALPAIAASVERLPEHARAHVFVEVSDQAEEQKPETLADVRLTWVHRGRARVGERLVQAVTAFELPPGRVHLFLHGEAGLVKELRRLLFVERGVPRAGQSISGYWRVGHTEDRWQATKRDWNTAVEQEQDGPTPA